MTWNHRFVRMKDDSPLGEGFVVQLCEVYYNDRGEPNGFCTAAPLYVNDEKDRFELGCMIASAACKDVLDASSLGHGEAFRYLDQEERERIERGPMEEAEDYEVAPVPDPVLFPGYEIWKDLDVDLFGLEQELDRAAAELRDVTNKAELRDIKINIISIITRFINSLVAVACDEDEED